LHVYLCADAGNGEASLIEPITFDIDPGNRDDWTIAASGLKIAEMVVI